MSDFRIVLTQEALEIGSRHKHREADAQKRQNALRLEVQQQEAIAEAARLAFERSLNFRAALGSDYACPNCWVANGERSPLIAQPEKIRGVDEFKCRVCDFEFSFLD